MDEGKHPQDLFAAGVKLMTPAAFQAFAASPEDNILHYLVRHVTGDWSEMDPEDREVNRRSVALGLRVLSEYALKTGVLIWIITEADRSSTTVLLAEEY